MDLKQRTDKLVLDFLSIDGLEHVYYEPSDSVTMRYPCVVIFRSSMNTRYANNKPYKLDNGFDCTYITKVSDDGMIEKIMYHFSKIRFIRSYTKNNLRHDLFKLFY